MISLMGTIPRTFVAHRFTYWFWFKFGSLRDLLTLVFRLGYSHKFPLQNPRSRFYLEKGTFNVRSIYCWIKTLELVKTETDSKFPNTSSCIKNSQSGHCTVLFRPENPSFTANIFPVMVSSFWRAILFLY